MFSMFRHLNVFPGGAFLRRCQFEFVYAFLLFEQDARRNINFINLIN